VIPPLILLLCIAGITCNLAFSGLAVQPDWSLALLVASVLAHRGNWTWALPGAFLHDLALQWSVWMIVPFLALTPALMAMLDFQAGPGLPQRLLVLMITTIPLLYWGWGFDTWLLTVLLCLSVWYILARRHVWA
jgi:hypothetical protein